MTVLSGDVLICSSESDGIEYARDLLHDCSVTI